MNIFLKKGYVYGIMWSLLGCWVSSVNDLIVKLSGLSLPGINVLFFRFLFSTLVLLPFVIKDRKAFSTKYIRTHGMRGGLFALAMIPWCYGLIQLPLPLVTAISFTTPLFVTALAFFLKEQVGLKRWAATGIGFLGIVISVSGTMFSDYEKSTSFHSFFFSDSFKFVCLALLATFLFAVLDITNKRLLILNEGMRPMMFFSALWTTLFILPLALWDWHTPALSEMILLFVLGIGANVFLLCLLKASSCCDLSALQPLRYSEFIFSSILSILVFNQWPSYTVVLGVLFVIPATIYLARHEIKLEKKKQQLDLSPLSMPS